VLAVCDGRGTPAGPIPSITKHTLYDNIDWINRFVNAFGSPNLAYGTEICNWHKDHAHAYTFGRSIASPDFENAGCVVLWGHNPSATWLDHATATTAARRRGARIIVVDPRRVGFAARAAQWLRVRPGSDGALALGIAREMIRNNWFDARFVSDWTNGPLLVRTDSERFLRAGELADPPIDAQPQDLLASDAERSELVAYSISHGSYARSCEHQLDASPELMLATGKTIRCRSAFGLYRDLCDTYPPERVEQLTWVSARQVTDTAKVLYASRPVSYYAWSGVGQHTNATQTDRAICLLMTLIGSFDAPGGNVEFARPAANDVKGAEFLSAEQRAKCIELKRSSLGPGTDGWGGSDALYNAILHGDPYPIRGLVNFGRNFLVNHADSERGARALSELDFLYIAMS
jgi:anaerobic selenocysteine-containing dehydrogenase